MAKSIVLYPINSFPPSVRSPRFPYVCCSSFITRFSVPSITSSSPSLTTLLFFRDERIAYHLLLRVRTWHYDWCYQEFISRSFFFATYCIDRVNYTAESSVLFSVFCVGSGCGSPDINSVYHRWISCHWWTEIPLTEGYNVGSTFLGIVYTLKTRSISLSLSRSLSLSPSPSPSPYPSISLYWSLSIKTDNTALSRILAS